jgi:PhnB protein
MKQLKPYLMFPGSCREALAFYKECLDGDITMIQTFGESPIEVSDEHKDRIFNSEFRADGIEFMASDDLPGNEVAVGSNFALFVTFSDKAEQKRAFDKLAEGGHVQFPLEHDFGMLMDKFRIQWMLAA